MKLLIHGLVIGLLIAQAAGARIAPPRPVQGSVTPILDALADMGPHTLGQEDAAYEKSAKLLGELFQVKTSASDEALAVLMNFYVGEALQDDLIHEVTVRGKRMLPLLLKYRKGQVAFAVRKYPESLLLKNDVRNENFENAIESIQAGKIIGED